MKRSEILNNDGQQCHQHQQKKTPPQKETTIINTTTLTIITVYNVDSDIILQPCITTIPNI